MNKIRAIIVAFLTGALLVIGGVSAQAATDNLICTQYGGKISVRSDSETGVRVWSSGPTTSPYYCGYNGVGAGQSSRNYTNMRDVDKFLVGTFWICYSQWGYGYTSNQAGGTWYALASDSVDLVLYCRGRGM